MKFSDVLDMLTRRDRSSKVETQPSSDLPTSIAPPPSALDLYVSSAPSPQNALDIFQGAWSSALPEPFSHLKAGTALLFNDPRIHWLIDTIGGVNNKSILELGPLEGDTHICLKKLVHLRSWRSSQTQMLFLSH